ncbi:DUF4337 domain-containing protein [Novosphingobium sp.]|uniref:DUF4337 domain-containing protein n=1 Tax=Novosphingobium sp. TaxID=1874826 RepID=UPI0025CB880C|nr:DUF4337 domain-containing protein [Novosphingobium sp.]
MEIEVSAEAKDKRLNRLVAITVVALSVFTGLCGIKDGNIVQNMQQAQVTSIDRWNEYQATRTKLHLAQSSREQIALLAPDLAKAAPTLVKLDAEIAKYTTEAPRLAKEAKEQSSAYDEFNRHDDQFDAADAALTTAISIAAVAALVESLPLLGLAWLFGAFGLVMGTAGFLGLGLHPDILARLLG